MKKIPLTQGQFALVDDDIYDELMQHVWCAGDGRRGKYYAKRGVVSNGKKTQIAMHRSLAGNPKGMIVDHRNGNTLDNQRHNLRVCTKSENTQNSKKHGIVITSSPYKGVSWSKAVNKWESYINKNRKRFHLGYFTCLIKAAKAYDKAAIKHHGEFAYLNFGEIMSKLIEEGERLLRSYCLTRAGYKCEVCGTEHDTLDCHHNLPKSVYAQHRLNPECVVVLCRRKCHDRAENFPEKHIAICRKKPKLSSRMKWYDDNKGIGKYPVEVDYESQVEELKKTDCIFE